MFYFFQAYWRARVSRTSDLVITADIDLTAELERVTDDVTCPADQTFCLFEVPLINDEVKMCYSCLFPVF